MIFLYYLLLFIGLSLKGQNKFVIGCWAGGIGANLNFVLQQLYYCDKYHYVPVIYWGKNSYYYDEVGFNGIRDNVWEYYFEPVSILGYDTNDQIITYYLESNPASYGFIYIDHVTDISRNNTYYLIKKYIKLRSAVQQKIDAFYDEHMACKKTIGIHLRGTDKYSDTPYIIDVESYINEALKHTTIDTQFLIATDEQKLLNKAITLLQGKKIIFYDCYRSDDGNPLHMPNRKPSFAQLGEDVLVEMFLLSKCDLLVHSISSVASCALYLNPLLKNICIKGYLPKD